jgi:hypothetical protein
MRQAAQFVIDNRHQFIQCGLITVAPRAQQLRYFMGFYVIPLG